LGVTVYFCGITRKKLDQSLFGLVELEGCV